MSLDPFGHPDHLQGHRSGALVRADRMPGSWIVPTGQCEARAAGLRSEACKAPAQLILRRPGCASQPRTLAEYHWQPESRHVSPGRCGFYDNHDAGLVASPARYSSQADQTASYEVVLIRSNAIDMRWSAEDVRLL
jgi:hypothetical protein